MKFQICFAVAICAVGGMVSATHAADFGEVRYDAQTVIRTHPRSIEDVRLLDAISGDRWSCGGSNPDGAVDYRVHVDDLQHLRGAGVEFEILIPDLEALVESERAEQNDPFRPRGFFDSFPDYATTSSYVNSLVSAYPQFVSRVSIGYSLENREIFGFRVTSPVAPLNGSPRKPVVMLNSLQHAREWITQTTDLYIATRLLELYSTDTTISGILDKYEVVFVPISNPDGYQITWTSDRYWRKNARVVSPPPMVVGVDLNRNWSVGWGLNNGSSGSYTSETYRGKSRFSEPESKALSDYMLAIPKLVAHIDIHSYASLLLRPWAYQYPTPPAIFAFNRIGPVVIAAIKSRTGYTYKYGGPEALYLASGVAPDWSYGTTDSISFTLEMRDSGYGFSPPASTIVPAGEDGLAAVIALVTSLCPADLNHDNVVDDSDFQLFVVAYDILLSNAGDFTGDGLTDDADFSQFVAAYDKLTCP